MAIKMKMRDGIDIEGSAEEIAELLNKLGVISGDMAEIKETLVNIEAGDLVRVISEEGFSLHRVGEVGTVVNADGTNRPLVDVNGVRQYSYVELVAKASDRKDH